MLRQRVVVELPVVDLRAGETVLATALTMLPEDVEVVLCLSGVDEPVEQQERVVREICRRILHGAEPPRLSIAGVASALSEPHITHVVAASDPAEASRAVLRLAAVSQALRSTVDFRSISVSSALEESPEKDHQRG